MERTKLLASPHRRGDQEELVIAVAWIYASPYKRSSDRDASLITA
jgi:hypothetical protein